MAERIASKAKRRPQKAPVAATRAKVPSKGATSRLEELEAECASLRREVAEARQRVATLERQREALANRIDWVIDSLHSLTEE